MNFRGINTDNGLLCGFLEDTIPVNDLSCRKKEIFSLTFCLVNSSRAACSFSNEDELTVERAEALLMKGLQAGRSSQLILTITVSEEASAMFRKNDGMGILVCEEGWQATAWIPDQYTPSVYRCMLFYKTSLPLSPLNTIYFQMYQAASTAAEGISILKADLLNIKNLPDSAFSFSFFKQPAVLKLQYFYPNPSAGASGAKLTLKWRTSNLLSGRINPGNIDICTPELMNADSCDIILKNTEAYTLTVKDSRGSISKFLKIYITMPEIIDFIYLPGTDQIKWEVYAARRLALSGRDKIPMAGTDAVKPGEKSITMVAEGDICSITCIYVFKGDGFSEGDYLMKTVHAFEGYRRIQIKWKAGNASEAVLRAEELQFYNISKEKSGVWENLFSSGIMPEFRLNYTVSGQKYEILV